MIEDQGVYGFKCGVPSDSAEGCSFESALLPQRFHSTQKRTVEKVRGHSP